MEGEIAQVGEPQITTVETIITNDELDSDAESVCGDSSGTDGATSIVEGKIRFMEETPGQVVAACVVVSFTE